MKQQPVLYVALLLLAWAALACKAGSTDKQQSSADAEPPAERTDSLYGFKGCDRAGFKIDSTGAREIKYQHYTFRLTDKADGGELIEFKIDSINYLLGKVPDVEQTIFMGSTRGHFFVDIGTETGTREVIVYSLLRGKLSQVYRTPYLTDYPPYISENASFWFYCPVEESEVDKMPDCPDKDAWIKDGRRVGYGQRHIYHMLNRGLTRKSEFVCAALK